MSVIRQNDIIVKYNIQDLEKTSQSFIERFEALSVLKKMKNCLLMKVQLIEDQF